MNSATLGPKEPRSRWRFSLKALLVLMLVVAAYFAGRAPVEQEVRRWEQLEQRRQSRALRLGVQVKAKAVEVAKAEYDESIAINQRAPGALSANELKRLKAAWDKARLELERAELVDLLNTK